MKPSILLPIDIANDNRHIYAFTLELAKFSNAEVTILIGYNAIGACISQCGDEQDESKHKAYHHLLELNGFYQQYVNAWQGGIHTKIQKKIQPGLLFQLISEQSRTQTYDLVITHLPADIHDSMATLAALLDFPCPVWTLPKNFQFPPQRNSRRLNQIYSSLHSLQKTIAKLSLTCPFLLTTILKKSDQFESDAA